MSIPQFDADVNSTMQMGVYWTKCRQARQCEPGLWHRRQWWCHVHRGNSWTLLCETSLVPLCPTIPATHN